MLSPQGISMLCAQYLGLYLGHSFFISQTMQKKEVFWQVLSLHILVQQPHEIVKFCIHKTLSGPPRAM